MNNKLETTIIPAPVGATVIIDNHGHSEEHELTAWCIEVRSRAGELIFVRRIPVTDQQELNEAFINSTEPYRVRYPDEVGSL